MTDVKVEQCDKDAAEELFGLVHLWRDDGCDHLRSLASDKSAFVAAFARHRQAAEKAQQERDARIADDYAAKAWGMTEEGHAAEQIATAIRSQGHE